MHRGGVGPDRGGGGQATAGTPGGGYRRDYHRNYRGPEYSHYGNYSNGAVNTPRKHEHNGAKYEANGTKYEGKYENGAKYEGNGKKYEGNAKYERSSSEDQVVPQAMLTSLEKKISSVQADLNQEIKEVTGKENEKFDLIFSILIELQRRQAQLEQSVLALKSANVSPMNASGGQQVQMPSPSSPSGQAPPSPSGNGSQSPHGQQGQQVGGQQMGDQLGGQQMGAQMGAQMNGQMGPAMNGYMSGGQMQYGSMVAPDGSQAFFPVVVAMPQNGAQMQYGVPQIVPAGPMPPMPQGMTLQYVGQGEDYQWGANGAGNNSAGAARNPATQPGESTSQTPVASAKEAPAGEQRKTDQPSFVEEE